METGFRLVIGVVVDTGIVPGATFDAYDGSYYGTLTVRSASFIALLGVSPG